MSCVAEIEMCVTRGDAFTYDVALTDEWSEILAAPGSHTANLVFRQTQSDALTPYLTLSAPAEVDPDPLPGEQPIYFRFSASPAETASLPARNHVAYVELVESGAVPTRLFNAIVDVHD